MAKFTKYNKDKLPYPVMTGKDNPSWKGGHYCLDCKVPVADLNVVRCRKCYIKFSVKTNAANWQGGKSLCIDCDQQRKCRKKNGQRCRSCFAIWNSKENNPNWKGGISFNPYPKIFNNALKISIRQRDNFTCQLCGKKEEQELKEHGRVLCVNHIDFDKNNCDPKNLNTLCVVCNNKINFKREFWTNYFKEVVCV